jgi:hypothetical protein
MFLELDVESPGSRSVIRLQLVNFLVKQLGLRKGVVFLPFNQQQSRNIAFGPTAMVFHPMM